MPARGEAMVRGMFAAAMAGLGALSLAYHGFAPLWLPLPGRPGWTDAGIPIVGIAIIAASIGLCVSRMALPSAASIAVYLAACTIARAFAIVAHPLSLGAWYGFFEMLAPLLALSLLHGLSRSPAQGPQANVPLIGPAANAARLGFGIACVVFGLGHFAYAEYTAGMVPSWLPARMGVAYATGLAHLAAGIGLMVRQCSCLAAVLEAAMMTSFGLLVWLPSFFATSPPEWAKPPRNQWSEFVLTGLLAASAMIVAASLRDHRWGFASQRRP